MNEEVRVEEQKPSKVKKQNKRKDIIRKIILAICIVVFIYSAYNLITILLDYKKIDDEFNDLRNEYVENVDQKSQYMNINWQELLTRNSDVIGWVAIPDTNINYPILYGETNDTYIRTTIDKEYSIAGSIFVDSNNHNPFVDLNTIMYGHNMKNDSMFSDLNEYLDSEYGKTHPYVYVYLPDGTVSKYKIVSAHKIDAFNEIYNLSNSDTTSFYQNILKDNTMSVEFDQDGTTPMIMLSTCATYDVDDPSRVVIHAQLEQRGIDPKTKKMQ